jgi:hypothetical protein
VAMSRNWSAATSRLVGKITGGIPPVGSDELVGNDRDWYEAGRAAINERLVSGVRQGLVGELVVQSHRR